MYIDVIMHSNLRHELNEKIRFKPNMILLTQSLYYIHHSLLELKALISSDIKYWTGMEYISSEIHGQMVLNLWLSALSDQDRVTHTASLSKTKRGLCGGMLIADGLEPPSMELSSSTLDWVFHTPSQCQRKKFQFFLVTYFLPSSIYLA